MSMHRICPDENGWYWIEDEYATWSMAYLEAETDQQRLVIMNADPGDEDVIVWKRDDDDDLWRPCQWWRGEAWQGPTRWIGPLGYPGGEFASNTVEFTAQVHEEADAQSKALVLVVADTSHCNEVPGSVIETCGIMTSDEAYRAIASVFPRTARGA